jgi:hypothetical protein
MVKRLLSKRLVDEPAKALERLKAAAELDRQRRT